MEDESNNQALQKREKYSTLRTAPTDVQFLMEISDLFVLVEVFHPFQLSSQVFSLFFLHSKVSSFILCLQSYLVSLQTRCFLNAFDVSRQISFLLFQFLCTPISMQHLCQWYFFISHSSSIASPAYYFLSNLASRPFLVSSSIFPLCTCISIYLSLFLFIENCLICRHQRVIASFVRSTFNDLTLISHSLVFCCQSLYIYPFPSLDRSNPL